MGISPELTSLEVMGIAIKSEIVAASLYRRMEGLTKNENLKEKIRFLISEEEKHEKMLRELFAKDFSGADLKLPQKSHIPAVAKALKRDLTLKELFQVAMRAEKKSERFYRDMADRSQDVTGKRTLMYLANMERGHYALLRNEYDFLVKYPDHYETLDSLREGDPTHMGP